MVIDSVSPRLASKQMPRFSISLISVVVLLPPIEIVARYVVDYATE